MSDGGSIDLMNGNMMEPNNYLNTVIHFLWEEKIMRIPGYGFDGTLKHHTHSYGFNALHAEH